MRRIVAEVSQIDPKFAPLIQRRPLCTLGRSEPSETHFESLVVKLCKGAVTPRKVIKLSDEQLREIGVSGAKSRTIKGIASAALDKSIPINEIDQIHDDQEIFDALTSIWGVGRWTVEMFMMFQLGRLDVWPTGDLAVRRGWDLIHKTKEETTAKALDVKGEKLRPYRSVFAWYCYQAVHEARGLDY